jgi:hypothetical protein
MEHKSLVCGNSGCSEGCWERRFGTALRECVVVPEPPRLGTYFGDLRKLEDAEADIAASYSVIVAKPGKRQVPPVYAKLRLCGGISILKSAGVRTLVSERVPNDFLCNRRLRGLIWFECFADTIA